MAAPLLVAFLARAIMPTGFMPGQGGVVMCHAYAPVPGAGGAYHAMMHHTPGMHMAGTDMSGMEMPAHAAHSPGGSHAPAHDSAGICPFAAAVSAGLAHQAPVVAAHAQPVSTAVDLPVQPCVPRATVVPTRLPRGPPTANA